MKENLLPQTNLEKKEIEILKNIVDRTDYNYKDYFETLNFSIDQLVTWLFENDITGSDMALHYSNLVFLKDNFEKLENNNKEKENQFYKSLKTYTGYNEMTETLDFTIDKLMPYFILVKMCGVELANDCQRLVILKNTFKELVKLKNQ